MDFVTSVIASLDSLSQNMDFVFSGIGLASLGALWALFRRFASALRTDTTPPQLRLDLVQRNRQRMLEKLQIMWVEGVLQQSLYQTARIELRLVENPGMIDLPRKLVMEQPERTPRALPDGVPMREVFEHFEQALLILGVPGSGKTTLLLELTRDLIARAKDDPAYPIPVVFNLSSWALRRRSLQAWIVDELNERYDVPRKIANAWVEDDQVLPLLDGLDEVPQEHRGACVDAINTFRNEHGLLPIAVCSRSGDYEALSVRLRLHGSVTIQPLSREQIAQYLQRAGKPLSGVSAAVRDDEMLWELIDTPLMLSILTLAYQGHIVSGIKIAQLKGDLAERRAALFDAYIEAMFTRRETATLYTPEQIRHWLSWLAQAMVQHNQTIFYLERIQPDWLPPKTVGLQRLGAILVSGLFAGLLFGLLFGLGTGLFFGLLFGLGTGLDSSGNIKPVEILRFSWEEAGSGLAFGLSAGLLFGLLGGMVGGLNAGLSAGLFVGLFLGLFVGLISGLNNALIADEIIERISPNEGIRRSFGNALITGVSIALFVVLVFGLLFGIFFGMGDGLGAVFFIGLLFALLGFLMKGGYACIRHGVLRVLLWRHNYAPLNYVRFLDHAVDQLLIRKLGGGYIFVARIIMEHFAAIERPVDGEFETEVEGVD